MKQKKLKEQLVSSGKVLIHKNGMSISIHKTNAGLWLNELATAHNRQIDQVEYTFMSDDELLKYNLEYLNHDTYTDIITFDLSDNSSINGSILISIDRIKENATKYKITQNKELLRVMAHGLLHLMGYKDKSTAEQKRMRQEEDKAIYLYEKFTKFHVK